MQLTGARAPKFVNADVLDSDLFSAFEQLCGQDEIPSGSKFDIILSNPPYVMDSEKAMMRKNVLDHEPHMALFVPDADPLVFYRAVADQAYELLASDGFGVVEINEALGEETAEVFRSRGFLKVEVVKDLYEKDRFVRFAWK
jgi:release factor glutamine methyltransferase